MTIKAAITGVAGVMALAALSAQAQDTAGDCAPDDDTTLSGWQGVWLPEGLETDISGRFLSRRSKFVGLDAPWNEAGWDRVRANLATLGTQDYRVVGFGFPAMMDTAGELSFYVGHNQTIVLNVYRDTQIIHTDGREHVPEEEAFPSTWGQSIGCWNGDTLTIDTRYAHFDPGFSPGHAPLSDEARFVERLELVAPGRIKMTMTITDPVYLAEPWIVESNILRYPSAESLLLDGSVNDRTVFSGDTQTISVEGSGGVALPEFPAPLQLTVEQMARLAGRYEMADTGTMITIEPRTDRLWVTMPLASEPSTVTPLYAETPDRAKGVIGHLFEFVEDGDGTVTGVRITLPDGSSAVGNRI